MNRVRPLCRARGFTLVEMMVALAVAVLLASVALPSFADHWRQARRSDAVVALTRLQMAQEQHRAVHGVYAFQLTQLKGASTRLSDQGWYDIGFDEVQPQRYRAVAAGRGSQSDDGACSRLVLEVVDGVAEHGPDARCWHR